MSDQFQTPVRQSLQRASGVCGFLVALSLGFTAIAGHAVEKSPRELTWQDLVPAASDEMTRRASALSEQFTGLDKVDRALYGQVETDLRLRAAIKEGLREADDFAPHEKVIYEGNPSASYPDITRFWTEVAEVRAAAKIQDEGVREDLDGRKVKIPGYVLPLDFNGQSVHEFLLVPYVGACIHTPPPPVNQIVYVKASAGFENKGMYEPVWVEGTMSTRSGKHDLSLVDGSSAVEAGYSLDALTISPYTD